MQKFEKLISDKIQEIATAEDPAHDFLHFQRVVIMAKKLCAAEKANINIVMPAAWLHDFVIVPKSSPLRSKASKMSAEKAVEFLKSINYPEQYLNDIAHAIEAHSFSANIETKTLEAKIVQDADRLDGLGAIGLARCFATAGLLKRSLYNDQDPFCEMRSPEDLKYTIDHFYQKLFKVVEQLKTENGRIEGKRRSSVMQQFLDDLQIEIKPS